MKIFGILIFFTFVYADKVWIPINEKSTMPKAEKETPLDINISQIKPINRLMQNAKVINYFLKNKDVKKEISKENEKKWFIIKDVQNP